MENETNQQAQKNDLQMVNATIVANGAMLIALQAAMRPAYRHRRQGASHAEDPHCRR
jgi:hypothetical protein